MFACVSRKGRKRGGNWGLARGVKMGQLTLSMGQEFAVLYKEPPFHTRGLSFAVTYDTHAINIVYVLPYCMSKNKFSLLQVKNKPCDGDLEHVFIPSLMDCTVANNQRNKQNLL
jgi:hypothetical protein